MPEVWELLHEAQDPPPKALPRLLYWSPHYGRYVIRDRETGVDYTPEGRRLTGYGSSSAELCEALSRAIRQINVVGGSW